VKLNPVKLAIASAVTMAVFWVICSFMVLVMPTMMMSMTGQMVHADLSGFNWTLTLSGFLVGLISWSISAGVTGWILAYIYNVLIKD
jgi:hypothetical protein